MGFIYLVSYSIRSVIVLMANSLILSGLGLATAGFAGRFIARTSPRILKAAELKLQQLPGPSTFSLEKLVQSWEKGKYYHGGFEGKMTRTEAFRILGISSNSSQKTINAQHKKIMLLNHPDRGGSPYMAAKINEAKDLVNKKL